MSYILPDLLIESVVVFAIVMFSLCQGIDLYWKVKGFFKRRSKNSKGK